MDYGENAPRASLSVRRTFDSMVRFELKKLACCWRVALGVRPEDHNHESHSVLVRAQGQAVR